MPMPILTILIILDTLEDCSITLIWRFSIAFPSSSTSSIPEDSKHIILLIFLLNPDFIVLSLNVPIILATGFVMLLFIITAQSVLNTIDITDEIEKSFISVVYILRTFDFSATAINAHF